MKDRALKKPSAGHPHINELLADARDVDLDAQPIGWHHDRWKRLWEQNPDFPCEEVLSEIDDEVTVHGTIRRSWLRELADGDPMRLLAASMIWGFGDFNRGPRSVKQMLSVRRSDEAISAVVAGIVEASKVGAAEGFSALFDGRGRTRVSHLGIAFGSKLVHFAGYDTARPRPLIFDFRVWNATRHVIGCPNLPSPRGYVRSADYEIYCSWAEATAAACPGEVEPAAVEYALFTYGGKLRRRRMTDDQTPRRQRGSDAGNAPPRRTTN